MTEKYVENKRIMTCHQLPPENEHEKNYVPKLAPMPST